MLQLLTSALVNLFVFGIALGAFYLLFIPSGRPQPDLPKPLAQNENHKSSVSDNLSADRGTANVGATAKSPATYRLQGIRAETGEEEIPSLLRGTWEIPESTEVRVHSLATNPKSPERKIATISFSETPPSLTFSKEAEWVSGANTELVLDTHFRGFTPLHSDPDSDCLLDCIAVSGLGGHAFGSFKSKENAFMWLRDALPKDLPHSRIFLYGYDAETVNSKSIENITDLGMELQHSINQIRSSRQGPARPLVLIGHSLGGLVVKETIINMAKQQTKDDQMNLYLLRAGLFFAVPTLGMNIESLIPMVEGKPNEDLVKSLKGTSETLRRQKEQFDIVSKSFSKYWYYETKESPTARLLGSKWSMTGPDALFVDPHSAANGFPRSSEQDRHFFEPINRTHSEVVKFPHREDRYYAKVSGHLERIKGEISRSKNGIILFPLTPPQSECVVSLAIEDQESRQRRIDLVPGTCQWIRRHPVFQKWERSHTGTLWIRGQPGSGKSSLMKHLLDELDCEKSNIARPMVVSFFFHGTGSEVHRSLFGFYSALLNQLLPEIPQFLCHEIFKRYEKGRSRRGKKFRWEMQELKDLLFSILSKATSAGIPIIILVDALDEAGQKSAMELMRYFRAVENIAKKTTDGIHRTLRICFSCRPYPIIVGQNHEIIIDVDQHNKEDLSMFICNKLKPDQSVGIDDKVLREVQNEIISKAGRTFQWASLMIKEINRMFTEMDTMSDIQDQISKTPSNLSQFYRQLISPTLLNENENTKPDPGKQALTLKLFQWLCFSKGPLTLTTIQHALVLGPEEPSIAKISDHRNFQPLKAMAVTVTKLSRGLVEIRSEDSEEIVQFTHQSVYDFLLETGLADLSGSEVAEVAGLGHFQISRACIRAMVMDDTQIFIENHLPPTGDKLQILRQGHLNAHGGSKMETFRYPIYRYDSPFNGSRRTSDKISARTPKPLLQSRGNSISVQQNLPQYSRQMIPVACYGSKHLCYHLAALEHRGWDQSDLPDLFNGTQLLSAWQDVLRLQREDSSIMHNLAASGITNVLEFCLRQDPRCCSVENDKGRTPLHCAIERGRDSVIELFTEEARKHGFIDIYRSDSHGKTPLHYAIRCGKEGIAKILIREALNHKTVNINHPTDDGWTVLHHAAKYGLEGAVKILAQEELVDVDYPNLMGWTPIFVAAYFQSVDGMRHLLQTGRVDVERKDRTGETPLAVAVWSACMEAVRLLREYNASVENKDDSGCTPLFHAVRKSNMKMVRYLVEETSASVDVLDNQGRGVLSYAAEAGNALMTRYILDVAPTQSEIAAKNGKLPITYALMELQQGGRREAFDALKAQMGRREESLLIQMTKYGQGEVVEYILDHEGPFSLENLEQALQVAQELEISKKEKIQSLIECAVQRFQNYQEKE